jgi:hypothetical protein
MVLAKLTYGVRILLAIFMFLGFANLCSGQQLAITSPASGAVFSPGQTIDVTVSVTNGQVLAVQVGAQDIGFTAYQTATPYSFTLTVPSQTIGPKNLFAVGLIANETVIPSPLISIDVEPSSQPTGIFFQQDLVTFGYEGQQRRIGLTATLGDGSTLDISQSTQLSFSSNNPSVVSVNPSGAMTARAPGNATITSLYSKLSATIKAIGPTAVKGDLNGDGVVTSDDLLILEAMLGSTPTGSNDARDINGDGKIDNKDVQALLSLCGSSCPPLNATTTNLSSSTNQIQFAKPVTLTATVSGNSSTPPTGSVSFEVDGRIQDISMLEASNHGSIVVASLPIGNHVITALYTGDSNNAPSTSQPVNLQIIPVPGDVNGDGVVNCLDLAIVKASFGKKTGQPGFDPRADVNKDGIVNILDLSIVARQLPAGTTCPQ